MFWIDTDKAIPAYDKQLVIIRVADFTTDYITEGWYDHNRQEWFRFDGLCLHNDVYGWKHPRPAKTIDFIERQRRMVQWQ